jgi:hypothetical protein
MQKECHSICHYRALMVDHNGTKYESNNCENNVENDVDWNNDAPKYQDTQMGSVANLNPFYHLNW